MELNKYEFDDLVVNESFQAWALGSSHEDAAYWDNWIANNKEQEQLALDAKRFIQHLDVAEPEQLSQEDIEAAVINTRNLIEKKGKERRLGLARMPIFRIAAAIALLLVSAQLIFQFVWHESKPFISPADQHMVEKVNPKGQKLTVTLKDGTTIKLNSNSKLRFPQQFDKAHRTVYLEGEAFFEVARNESKPFYVVTDKLKVAVLGTSFNVSSYKQESLYKVAVATGKVSVSPVDGKASGTTFLLPDEMAVLDKTNGQLSKQTYDKDEILGWKSGTLFFNNLPIKDIARRLENWYGVNVHLQNTIDSTQLYYGKFYNESLPNILDALMFTKGASYRIEGDNIYLY